MSLFVFASLNGADIDAMIPFYTWWVVWGGLGVALGTMGLVHKYVAYAAFAYGVAVSVFLTYSAFKDLFTKYIDGPSLYNMMTMNNSWTDNLWGALWIISFVVAKLSPAIITGLVVLWHKKRAHNQGKVGEQTSMT